MPHVANDGTHDDSQKVILIGFRAGRARKRAARMLAAKLDFDDVSDMMKWLLDQQVAKYFPEEMKEIEEEDPKARSRRQARKKAG